MLILPTPLTDILAPRFRVGILDAGIVVSLSSRDRQNFLDLFSAVADGDGSRAAKLMVERSDDPSTVLNGEEFEREMTDIVNRVRESTFKVS